MRKNTLTLISILFLTLSLVNCEDPKPENKKFVYQIKNSKVEMKIENRMDFLYYGNLTKADFIMSNIDQNSLIVFGAGIRIIGGGNGIFKTEINVPENYLEADTLNIKIRFKINGEKFEHMFNVPLKEKK